MTDYKKIVIKLFICLLLALLLIPLIFVGIKQDSAKASIDDITPVIFNPSKLEAHNVLIGGNNTLYSDFIVKKDTSSPFQHAYYSFYDANNNLLYYLDYDYNFVGGTFNLIVDYNGVVSTYVEPIGYKTISLGTYYSLRIASGRNEYGTVWHTFEYNGKLVSSIQRVQEPYVHYCSIAFTEYNYTILDSVRWEVPSVATLFASVYVSSRFGGFVLLNFNTWNSYGYDLGHAEGVESSYASWDNLLPSIMGSYASFFLILLGGIEIFGTSLLVLLGSIGALAVVFIVISKLRG